MMVCNDDLTWDPRPGLPATQGLVPGAAQSVAQPAHAAAPRALPHAEEPGPGAGAGQTDVPAQVSQHPGAGAWHPGHVLADPAREEEGGDVEQGGGLIMVSLEMEMCCVCLLLCHGPVCHWWGAGHYWGADTHCRESRGIASRRCECRARVGRMTGVDRERCEMWHRPLTRAHQHGLISHANCYI